MGSSKNEANSLELLEIYKLSVEMADRVSSRRGQANAFFVTLQTALTSLSVFSLQDLSLNEKPIGVFPLAAGVLASIVWWLQLRSYRDLNASKFKVICEIEKSLVFQAFMLENERMPKDKIKWFRGKYSELGFSERVVPWIFVLLYVSAACAVFLR